MNYQVLLLYTYTHIHDPHKYAQTLRRLCITHQLKGRIIVAHEGVNLTVEGEIRDTNQFIKKLLQDNIFKGVHIKKSTSDGRSFPKLAVKVKEEIVTTRFPKEIDPTKNTGTHLTPEELHSWFNKNKKFVIIDMRNDYEYKSGHFKNSINPQLEASRELEEKIEELQQYKDTTVVAVCTGGVRCEKMSAYLKHHNFEKVYQLQGGIHSYMEKFPGQHFLGTLYTFDQRKVMNFGGKREMVGKCYLCGSATEEYTNCANDFCHYHFLVCVSCCDKEGVYCSKECKIKDTVSNTTLQE